MIELSQSDKNALLERFIKYVKIWTTSDSKAADSGMQPSTDRQFDLARLLQKELCELGLKDVQVTEHCYVYGNLPASKGLESEKSFCLLAHLDTVEEVSGQNVKPIITQQNNDTIIHSDGTTLLGADDKAGISAIMQALSYLFQHKELKHGQIEVCFSPDEETGHGMDNVPLNLIKSKQAYTVDGGECGQLEIECFNAYKSEIIFTGVSQHTGTARGKLVNAISMASSFINSLPHHQLPETTDGYMGFYAPMEINGTIEQSNVTLFLRDFDENAMNEKLKTVQTLAESVALSFGGKVSVTHTCQYKNMKVGLEKSPATVDNLVQAYKNAGIEPIFTPIRGGTDGSRLTEMGIPTPNIFTGGSNFHSRQEFLSLNALCKCVEVLLNLAVKN